MQSGARNAILCVDDDPSLLEFEKTFLEAFGYRVTTASSGAEGLAMLEAADFDAVVLDYHMPGMDGAVVAERIRESYPLLPVVIFSGFLEQVPDSLLAQVDGFVHKGSGPPSALVGVLERALGPGRSQGSRRFPRFRVLLPFVLTYEREGSKTQVRGVCNTLGEGGLGGIVEQNLAPGALVWVELLVPASGSQIAGQAAVRYRRGAAHGFEFLNMAAVQQAELRRCCHLFQA